MLLMILSIVDDIGSNSVFDCIRDSKFLLIIGCWPL